MKKEKVIARVSVGFTQRQLDMMHAALRVRYGNRAFEVTSRTERSNFLRLAVWGYCSAVVRQCDEYSATMLACDVRRETDPEFAARVGHKRSHAGLGRTKT